MRKPLMRITVIRLTKTRKEDLIALLRSNDVFQSLPKESDDLESFLQHAYKGLSRGLLVVRWRTNSKPDFSKFQVVGDDITVDGWEAFMKRNENYREFNNHITDAEGKVPGRITTPPIVKKPLTWNEIGKSAIKKKTVKRVRRKKASVKRVVKKKKKH